MRAAQGHVAGALVAARACRESPRGVVRLQIRSARRLVPHAAAAVVFAVASVAMTYPLALHLADHIRDHADQYEYAWLLGYAAQKLLADPLGLFDANIYYPFKGSLAYSDSTLGSVVLALPVLLTTRNPILANNLLLLLSFALAGLGVYLLVWDYTHRWPAAILAGLIFAFSPVRMDHLVQIPNFSSQWIPLALFGLRRFWVERRPAWAAWFAVALSMQALASFYFAYVVALMVAIYLAFRFAREPGRLLDRPTIAPLLIALLVCAAIIAPVALPYFQVQERYGFRRTIEEAEYFSALPRNFLAVEPENRLYGPRMSDGMERVLFPGFVALALAAGGALSRRRGDESGTYVAIGAVAVVLAFGPSLHLTSLDRPVSLPFHMPYWYLYQYLPGFQALRVPTRFGVMAMLSVAVLAGLGASGLASLLATRLPGPISRLLAPATAAILAALALAEYVEVPLRFVPVPVGDSIPAAYRWLAAQPERGVLAEVPINLVPDEQAPYCYYSTYHGWTLVNGKRSFYPPEYKPLAATLDGFPSPEAIDRLRALDAKYVILHGSRYDAQELARRSRLAESQPDKIRLVQRFGDDLLYEVLASYHPEPIVPELRLSLPPNTDAGSTTRASLAWRAPGKDPLVLPAETRELAATLIWQPLDGGSTREVALRKPLERVVEPAGELAFDVTTPAAPGRYRVALTLGSPASWTAGEVAASEVTVLPVSPAYPANEPGDVRIVAAELPVTRLAPGGSPVVEVTLEAERNLTLSSQLSVNVFDRSGRYWSQETTPAMGSSPANRTWNRGERGVARLATRLDPTTPPGLYTVEVALTNPRTGSRQPVVGRDGKSSPAYEVGQIAVLPETLGRVVSEPEHAVGATLEDGLVLLGWSPAGSDLAPGGVVRVQLQLAATSRPSRDYTVFLHLVDAAGNLVGQRDARPLDGAYPTSLWTDGVRVAEEWIVPVPATALPGDYRLVFGVYDVTTMRRLAVVSPVAADHLSIARLHLASSATESRLMPEDALGD